MRSQALVAVALIILACAVPVGADSISLVTLGDSLTAGDGDDGVGGGYPPRLLGLLQADHPNSTLSNLAVSGLTSNDLINIELDPAVSHLNSAPSGSQRMALVWIGSNDLFGLYNWVCDNDYNNNYAACEQAEVESFREHVDTILTALRGTGAAVYIALLDDQSKRPVMTDPALRTASFPSISAEDVTRMSAQVARFNTEIEALAASHGAGTVDFFHTTLFEEWATLASDGNHPNGTGYDQIADIWYQAVSGGTPSTYRLTVTTDGTGSGTVTSNPAGIGCGSDCSEDYAPGTHVTLTATAASGSTFGGWGGSCSGTGQCSVTMNSALTVRATFTSGASYAYNYVIPVVIHGPGDAGTAWRSSVALLNGGSGSASLSLRLETASSSLNATSTLGAGATREWEDVVVDLFAASPSASTSGAMHVASTQPLLITSRTYNQGSAGTYGQYLPALTTSDALSGTRRGYLIHLKGIGFRTNIGFVNLGQSSCTVRLTLHDSNGAAIGAAKDTTLSAGKWTQRNDVFTFVGAAAQDLAYATVEIPSGVGSFWAYASVIDDETGDATTIPVLEE